MKIIFDAPCCGGPIYFETHDHELFNELRSYVERQLSNPKDWLRDNFRTYVLTNPMSLKIALIKALRENYPLTLTDAKVIVENYQPFREYDEATKLIAQYDMTVTRRAF